ncbi:hypothetical protein JTE90_025382 [Oedothorax gibbosus]|uniref:Uncharacterized protein n=1 Tax=Oedothorax gibbosus TaxID=931172 RepID=A0AAV6TIN7_9ARAC|nr:hypothetical protein JTE90_025382 [Oedothorax gibbosus]
MLIFKSLFLVTLGVFASATEDGVCDPKQPELCFSPSVHADFPGSEEELDKICPVFNPDSSVCRILKKEM